MATRPSAEFIIVGLTIVSIIGVVTSRSSALTIPVLQDAQSAPMQTVDEDSESRPPQVVSWLTFPYSSINKVPSAYVDDQLNTLQYNGQARLRYGTIDGYDADDIELPIRTRSKKYKLSFYDCISLYCGERFGPERGQCILKFCHRTK